MEGDTGTGLEGFVESGERRSGRCEVQNGPPQLLSSSENTATIEPSVLVLGMFLSEDNDSDRCSPHATWEISGSDL